MPTVSRFVLACAAGLILSASGCARTCHDGQNYCVDCRYCPPPPLPYTYYNECACHSCAASKHLTNYSLDEHTGIESDYALQEE